VRQTNGASWTWFLAALLCLATFGCGGGNGELVPPLIVGKPFYVTNDDNTVTEYILGQSGNVAPHAVIGGNLTQLDNPAGIAVDSAHKIYVANTNSDAINIYPANAHGNIAPIATIAGVNTLLDEPSGLALDAAGNIYVVNSANNSITVYPANSSGDATPSAVITGGNTDLDTPIGIALDAAGNIYVANFAGDSVTEYAAGSNGNVSPIATISGPDTQIVFPEGVAIDRNGNIFVTNFNDFMTFVIAEFPAGSNGDTVPTKTIAGPKTKLNFPIGILVDHRGRVAVANAEQDALTNSSITLYSRHASGNAHPVAIIKGPATGLFGPLFLALVP
jgi:sugar lactone lactonase YvrE